ncbi:hypothetical protein, partial [Deinococcus wulumuqiensis]|uniref:hypothetical protein n=1 Tax=Deinococcus wulumuqiensis TaxID=980427 RepID=UPI001CEF6196
MNLVVSDSIRADASRKKYGFRDMDAQAALSRLCRNEAESVLPMVRTVLGGFDAEFKRPSRMFFQLVKSR